MNTLQSQSRLKVYLQRVAGWYSFAAVTLFNILLLFVLFNLALAVAFYFRGPEPGKPSGKTPTYSEATFQAVYPDFTCAQREQLLRETWTRPFGYDDFVHFRELPF